MEYWEFLLQKEGDRSWLPLESPDVEILEGRYRIVARSSRVNAPVEIRITHLNTAEQPPKRRLQSRLGHTNQDGLIVVIPFTRMQSGVWELSCRGDLMADMLGEGWQYAVQLQVLPQEADEWDEAWQPEAAGQTTAAPPAAIENGADAIGASETGSETISAASEAVHSTALDESAASAVPEALRHSEILERTETVEVGLPVAEVSKADAAAPDLQPLELLSGEASVTAWAEQLSEQFVSSLFEAAFEEGADSPATAAVAAELSSVPDAVVLQLALSQEAFMLQRGQDLCLTGNVYAADAAPQPFSGLLTIMLRDPQRSAVLLTHTYPITGKLPLLFSCPLSIPEEYQTHLLLGELRLTAAEETVATATFTVTTDLEELLEAIADEFPESDLLQPPLEFAGTPETALNVSFLELIADPAPPPLQFQPSTAPALPPQLYQPDPDRPKPQGLDLPFAARPPQTAAPLSEPQIGAEMALAVDDETAAPEPSAPAPAAIDASADSSLASSVDTPLDTPIDWQPAAGSKGWLIPSPPGQLESPATPEDLAFQSLNLRQRFWSRLSALASDTQQPPWSGAVDGSLSALPDAEALAGSDADLVAHEIVVEDALPPQRQASADLEPPASLVLPKEEPVPTPRLYLSTDELVAGTAVKVAVRLPNLAPRIYAKLWLRDRQTRLLLDGPRWLVDFAPTGLGELEARTELTVPLGCLDVQFEAIAVEMATQRESHKVSVEQTIVPPDLPTLSLDELDV